MKVNKKITVLTAIISVLVILSLGKVQALGNQLEENNNIVLPQNSIDETLSQDNVVDKDNEIVDNTDDKTKDETDNNKDNGDKTNTETTSGDWTDFSNAKFELKKEGFRSAIVEISDVTKKNDSRYLLLITSNSSKPTIDEHEQPKDSCYLEFDNNSKKMKALRHNAKIC